MSSGPVENLLSRLDGVHRNGSGATAKCPAHDDQRASLSVGEGGDGRVLVRCHAGCSSEEIVERLGLGKADLFVKPEGARVVAEYAYRDEGGTVRYVAERREPKDFRQRRPDGNGGWLWNLQGVAPLPYRLPELLAADATLPVVIVEGEKDVDRLLKLGFVATTNSGGAGKWRSELSRYLAGRCVVIIPDNDEPGRKHALQIAHSLRDVASTVSILTIPGLPPKGDASTWLNNGGTADQLKQMVADARQFDAAAEKLAPVDGIADSATLRTSVEELHAVGLQPGSSTGFRSLDEYFTVRRGELTLVTGIPGHGKSGWLDHVMVNLARREEWHVAIYSAESYPVARHAASLLEKALGKPFTKGPTERMSLEDVGKAWAMLDYCFRFIDPTEEQRSVDGILAIVESLAARERIDAVVIDPWNELDHTRPDGVTETEHVSRCLSRIRRFARDHQMHVFIVAHPAKMQKTDGKYPVPTPYDVAGSAHWRNRADNCITVWRDITDGDKPEVEIHVQKIRFREVGRIGMATLLYDKVTGRYNDPARERSEFKRSY